MLVHSCPVFGYDETSPISRSSAVQLLSPHNEHSIVFDLPYDERCVSGSIWVSCHGLSRRLALAIAA